MAERTELQNDMYELAKLVYKLSKKYGGIYISAAKAADKYGGNLSWTTYEIDGKYYDEDYWPDKDKEGE